MGNIWKAFQKDTQDAAVWTTNAIFNMQCSIRTLKWDLDHPTEIGNAPKCNYLEKDRARHDIQWERFYMISIGILALIVGGVIMWYIFPALSILGDVFTGLYDVTTYIWSALGSLFSMWRWLYDVDMSFFTETMMETLGGSPTLWWIMGMESLGLSVVYVLAGIMGIWHVLLDTPIEEVFGFLNTPFRWIRINVLQRFFGKTLGNILSLIELPLESMVFLLSLPIAGIWWVYERLIDGKNTGG